MKTIRNDWHGRDLPLGKNGSARWTREDPEATTLTVYSFDRRDGLLWKCETDNVMVAQYAWQRAVQDALGTEDASSPSEVRGYGPRL